MQKIVGGRCPRFSISAGAQPGGKGRKMMSFRKCWSWVLLFGAFGLSAGEFLIVGTPDRKTGIYDKGEEITFSILVTEDKKPVSGVKLVCELVLDGKSSTTREFLTDGKPCEIRARRDDPGWVYVTGKLFDAEGREIKIKESSSDGVGALVSPGELRGGPEPEDFDAFWQAQRAMLDKVPVKASREAVSSRDGFDTYDVKVDCAGPKPVSGYLTIPKNAAPKSLPVVVSYHGAGVRSAGKSYRPGAISFDVNAHGIANGQPPAFYNALAGGELRGYSHQHKTSREEFYFCNVYLRVMRALDYAKTLPEWDGKRLIVVGSSQGGAQAIVAAALDHDVTLCVAGVPALSDHFGSLSAPPHRPGWPRLFIVQNGKPTPSQELVARASAYYDNVFFAKRIRCDTYMSTGFNDASCSPVGVWIVYHNLPKNCRKGFTITPNGNHRTSKNTAGNAALEAALK